MQSAIEEKNRAVWLLSHFLIYKQEKLSDSTLMSHPIVEESILSDQQVD